MEKYMYKVLVVYVIVMVFFYIYCSPVSNEFMLEILKGSLLISAFSFLYVWSIKSDRYFTSNHVPRFISEFSKRGLLIFMIPFAIFSAIAFVRILMTKRFDLTIFFLPTIFFFYNGEKAYKMASEDLENNKKK